MNRFNRVRLPTDLKEFETLVQKVCKKFGLKDQRHASAVISVAIRHIPNEQAYTTYDYLGQYVLKSIANHVANHMGEFAKHETQVEQLANLLEQDPNNFEARDALYEAAAQGSDSAKKALEKYEAAGGKESVLN